MKTTLNDLKEGATIVIDADFTCAKEGEHKVCVDDRGFYFKCSHGKHYLDGQEDESGKLVGVSLKRETMR